MKNPYGKPKPDDQLDPNWNSADWYRDGELRRERELQQTLGKLATKDDVFLWQFLMPALAIFVLIVALLVWARFEVIVGITLTVGAVLLALLVAIATHPGRYCNWRDWP